jgi:GDP-4-dehydro-6-deoxy-D-mannose reductase
MKKYLITGFSGFVGRHFLEFLENNRIEAVVRGLDIRSPDFRYDCFEHIKCYFEETNLVCQGEVERIIYEFQPDYVLHLASFSSVAFSWKEPTISFQNNTNIFLNLLEAARKTNVSARILSIGSSEEYGDVDKEDLPLTEDHPLKPGSPYAVARVSQEFLSQIYTSGYGLDIVMTRSFNHVGPFQKDIFVVSSFVKQLLRMRNEGGNRELITGDPEIIRDFTDVRDVASAYYLLLTQGETGGIYNVCSGIGISLKEIIYKICDVLDIDVDIHVDPNLLRPNDNRIIIGSNEKIRSNYGWSPKYVLEESLKDLIDYWQSMK